MKALQKSELADLIAPGLADADDSVREAWDRIRIAPEKWQCSPTPEARSGRAPRVSPKIAMSDPACRMLEASQPSGGIMTRLSIGRYIEELTPEGFLWASVPKRRVIGLLIVEVGLILAGTLAFSVVTELRDAFFAGTAAFGVLCNLVNFWLLRRWRCARLSEMEHRTVTSAHLDETIEEARATKLLEPFVGEEPHTIIELVGVEIEFRGRELEWQSVVKKMLAAPEWLSKSAGPFVGVALGVIGKLAVDIQFQLLMWVAAIGWLLYGVVSMVLAVFPSRRLRAVGYLGLLYRVKRRLEMEAILRGQADRRRASGLVATPRVLVEANHSIGAAANDAPIDGAVVSGAPRVELR